MKEKLMHKNIITLILVISSVGFSATDDEIKQVLDIYKRQSAEIGANKAIPPDVKRKFWREWLFKFTDLAKSSSKSPYYTVLLVKSQTLANGLEEYSLSETLAKEILESHTDIEGKVKWNGEIAEINRQQYLKTSEKKYARVASDYFEKAIQLGGKISRSSGRLKFFIFPC